MKHYYGDYDPVFIKSSIDVFQHVFDVLSASKAIAMHNLSTTSF